MSRYDHSACLDGAHDRAAGDQSGDRSDAQRRDAENRLLCNHCEAPLMFCYTVDDYDHVDPDTPGCFLVPDSNHVALVDMTEIARLVREHDIDAFVEHSGGGIWTIYAGRRFGDRVAALAGPSTSTPDTRHMGDPNDFYVGPDDDGMLRVPSVAERGATTPHQIAELITALVRETEKHRDEHNACVVCAATFDDSSEHADEWTFHWDRPTGTEIVAESCCVEHAQYVERMRGDDGVLPVWDAARPAHICERPYVHDDATGAAKSDRALSDTGTASDARIGADAVVDTPVFHATVQALAAGQREIDAGAGGVLGAPSAVEHAGTDTASGTVKDSGAGRVRIASPADARVDTPDTLDAADVDWVDQWYGDAPAPPPVIDPDSPEGAAILSLFGRIKDLEHSDGNWPGGDVVDALTGWFTELGVDPDEQPLGAGRRLRLALRERPGGGLVSSVYGVRINTDHDDPEAIIRTALHVLARQLGAGTSIELVSHDRDLLARIEHDRPDPNRVPEAGS